jgi:hypothetical protein
METLTCTTLRRAGNISVAMANKPAVAKRTGPQTVFVVDDDVGVRDSLRFLLKSVGLTTRTAVSAAEFLDSYDPHQGGCLVRMCLDLQPGSRRD